jgi:hypothetical protein
MPVVVADTGPVNYLVQNRRHRRPGEAFTRLKATTFHYRQGLLDALLTRQQGENK